MFENLLLVNIQKNNQRDLDLALAALDSNKLIPGTIEYGRVEDKETGKESFFYRALSKV